jgi:threonine aldolase
MAREGVLMIPYGHGRVRAVTHHGIKRRHVERAAEVVGRVLAASSQPVVAGAA